MGFLGIYRAIYDYTPSGEGELEIQDGDLLFVQDKGEDDWWKAKKKAASDDEDEPEGLIPANYVEKAEPIASAKALYDYARQTDEELSFAEDAPLDVYDNSDPDWTLVGAKGEFGFAPANYIEIAEDAPPTPARSRPVPSEPEPEPEGPPTPGSTPSPVRGPAAALAGIIKQRTGDGGLAARRAVSPPPAVGLPARPQFTPEESEEEAPAPRLPQRPPSEAAMSPPPQVSKGVRFQSPTSPEPHGVIASPPYNRQRSMRDDQDEALSSPGGYHIYNIYEMVEVLGRSKKMPVTLGINIAKGTIMISAEKESSQKEWTADKMTHYSIEGKHVFMELIKPSKSIDFHAGAKDTAQEIVSALGDLAGAYRSEGLQEVMDAAAGNVQKKGKMIYEFMAQGDDEVTVAEGDEVIILDDAKSDEWWMVRRLKNGKEGVVPSNYVDIIGTVRVPVTIPPPVISPPSPQSPPAASSRSSSNTRSMVEQNRREEERLAKQAAKNRRAAEAVASTPDGASGLHLPKRHSSLMTEDTRRSSSQKGKRGSRDSKSDKKSLPNTSKVRTWTDRSGSFKVEAEFLGLRDEKIHLHKLNGVKIAVPVPKMSVEDLEFVERETGVSLDELKPLSDIKRRSSRRAPAAGASVDKKPDHDWFDFFLQAGIDPQVCERYSQAFNRDSIGEENLDDVTPALLRTIGFKEGDILRVMKSLDQKFGRSRQQGDAEGTNGRLFSGPGGALKNNTAKGRPVPATETRNELDPELLKQGTGSSEKRATPIAHAPTPDSKATNGFDDNAWEPRASKRPATASPPPTATAASPPPPAQPALTPGMAAMSLLDAPLVPTPAAQPEPPKAQSPPSATSEPAQPAQPTGATPSLFEQLAKGPANQHKPRPNQPQGIQQGATGSLIAPPPGRSASAPQNPNQQSAFQAPPLQPQLTGYNPQLPLRMQTTAVPPGQSMADMNQQRLYQQQQSFLQPQATGYPGNPGFNQFQPNALQPQPTGYGFGGFGPQPAGYANPSLQQALVNGQQNGSPFADPPRAPFQPQATGYGGYNPSPLQSQATGVNAFLPPALQPQATGIHANQFNNQSFSPPPMPPMPPQQQAPAPLMPQKTGPAPPVRFGTAAAKRLAPQPTGRANLSKATAQNPFGFG